MRCERAKLDGRDCHEYSEQCGLEVPCHRHAVPLSCYKPPLVRNSVALAVVPQLVVQVGMATLAQAHKVFGVFPEDALVVQVVNVEPFARSARSALVPVPL